MSYGESNEENVIFLYVVFDITTTKLESFHHYKPEYLFISVQTPSVQTRTEILKSLATNWEVQTGKI